MTNREWFARNYDEAVGSEVDGLAVAKANESVARNYLDAVERGEIDADSEMERAIALTEKRLKPIRRARKDSFRREVRDLLDALNDDTILGRDDPRLQQAFPVGDGRDKKLANWTADDWLTSIQVHQQNAQAVTVAATEFTEVATDAMKAQSRRGVLMFGDLYGGAA